MKKNKFFSDFSWVSFFIFVLIFLKVSVFGINLVPSSSMEPNILSGDRIFSNKLAYGLNLPFVKSSFFQWAIPQRGDVILFSFENNSDLYVKRVIGLPGDLITFKKGQVYINDEPLTLQIQNNQPEVLKTLVYQEKSQSLSLPAHFVSLSNEPAATFFENRRFLVPPNKFFVLGDNRDNSADSRVYGYVDIKNVYAKVYSILFSTTGENVLPEFRKGRTFLKLN